MKFFFNSLQLVILIFTLFSSKPAYSWVWAGLGWEVVRELAIEIAAGAVNDSFKDNVSSKDIAKLNAQLRAKLSRQLSELQNATKQVITTSEQLTPQQFKLTYVYRTQGQGNFKTFSTDDVLHSGDTFKIIMQTSVTSYVYLFQQDSRGEIVSLFPMAQLGGEPLNNLNPLQTGRIYYLPAPDKSFQLDNNIGIETLFFTASKQPNPVFKNFYQAIERARKSRNEELGNALQAQFTQVFDWQSKSIVDVAVNDAPIAVQEGNDKNVVQGYKFKDLYTNGTVVLRFKHY